MNTIDATQPADTLDGDQVQSALISNVSAPLLGRSLGANSARLEKAIEWLSLHRDTITGPPVPAVRLKFELTNLEAIEALRRGRALRNARAL